MIDDEEEHSRAIIPNDEISSGLVVGTMKLSKRRIAEEEIIVEESSGEASPCINEQNQFSNGDRLSVQVENIYDEGNFSSSINSYKLDDNFPMVESQHEEANLVSKTAKLRRRYSFTSTLSNLLQQTKSSVNTVNNSIIAGGRSLLSPLRQRRNNSMTVMDDEKYHDLIRYETIEIKVTDPQNNEILDMVTEVPILNSQINHTAPPQSQNKIFSLSSIFTKAISGWKRRPTKRQSRNLSTIKRKSLNLLHGDIFRKSRRKTVLKDVFSILPLEIWAYCILPYLRWTDMLTLRSLNSQLTVIIQERAEVWNELFEQKLSRYFATKTFDYLWKSNLPRDYQFFNLDEIVVRNYFRSTLFGTVKEEYTRKYSLLKQKYTDNLNGSIIIPNTHTESKPVTSENFSQEGFVSYLSCSKVISTRKQQANSRKLYTDFQFLKNTNNRHAWIRVFTVFFTILSAVAALVCITVKDYAFSQEIDWVSICNSNDKVTILNYLKVMDTSWTIPFIPAYIGILFSLGVVLYFWIQYHLNDSTYSLENDGRFRRPREIYFLMTFCLVCTLLYFVFLNIHMVHPYCKNVVSQYYKDTSSYNEQERSNILLSEIFSNGVIVSSPLFAIMVAITYLLIRSCYTGILYQRNITKNVSRVVVFGMYIWKFIVPFIIWISVIFSLILLVLYLSLTAMHPLIATIPIMLFHIACILIFGWTLIVNSFMLITCSFERQQLPRTLASILYSFLLITLPFVFYTFLGLEMREGIVALPCAGFLIALVLFGMNYQNDLEILLEMDEMAWPFS